MGYIQFDKVKDNGVFKSIFETTKTVKELLDEIHTKIIDPLDRKFLILLDFNNKECKESDKVEVYTSSNTSLTLDYTGHTALQLLDSKYLIIPNA